ncbi:MAG TPA: PDR/VanB family oxidoreductase [Burkholderiaceae bacterium]
MTREFIEVLVARKQAEARDIVSYELVDPSGNPLAPFEAGAHIDVRLRDGLTRSYSLLNAPGDSHRYRIAVLRDPNTRGGSAAMHDEVHEGASLAIAPPLNHFALAPGAPYSLLLAGGIGVTPLLSMAEHLQAAGAAFEMHYCGRSPERTAFVEEIAAAAYGAWVRLHYDDGPVPQRLDIDAVLAHCPAGTHLYVCGPRGFIDAMTGRAVAAGWPPQRIHCEFFGGPAAAQAGDGGFEVTLARSGRTVRVAPDQSVVQALAARGIALDTSCEQGVCGVCLTRVLQGTPDHRDMVLSDEERARNDLFTPCCSRALSAVLVLDL